MISSPPVVVTRPPAIAPESCVIGFLISGTSAILHFPQGKTATGVFVSMQARIIPDTVMSQSPTTTTLSTMLVFMIAVAKLFAVARQDCANFALCGFILAE